MFNKLPRLKRKAAKLYREATHNDLSCGLTLAELLNPKIYRAKQEFNKVYAEIQKLDPGAPKNPFA